MKKVSESVGKTATTELPKLWESGFLSEWRLANEVTIGFAKMGCHFTPSAVSKALLRAKFVTRKGKKGAGVKYIQTYPFEK